MSEYLKRAEHPTFVLFTQRNGVTRLDPYLTINGTTKAPTLRYKGGDADGTDWDPWQFGETCTLQAGTAPSYNQGSPALGAEDDSVLGNSGGYYESSETSSGDIGSNDIVVEVIFKSSSGTVSIAGKGEGSGGGTGWDLTLVSNKLYIELILSDTPTHIKTDTLTEDTWYHAIFFINRDENSTDGAKVYVNGVLSGSANVSTVDGDISNSDEFTLLSRGVGGLPFDSNVAYVALWQQANWHQAGASGPAEWVTIAEERFAKFAGYYPQYAAGTAAPTTMTRASEAYIEKYNESTSKIDLYYMGDEWLRMVKRKDANGKVGDFFLREGQVTNKITESEDFNTTWAKIDGYDTITSNDAECPDKRTVADALIAYASDGQHGVSIAPTLTATEYVLSVFAKPGNKDWIKLENTTVANCSCYFDVANGTVGTAGAGAAGYIEGPFYGDFYRCCIVFVGTAAAHTLRILSADADNDDSFAGDGSTKNTYLWGAQCETNGIDYMTSPIITDGGESTRSRDELGFAAGDNIGGEDNQVGTALIDFLLPDVPATQMYCFCIYDDGAVSTDRIDFRFSNSDQFAIDTRASGGNNGGAQASGSVFDNQIHSIRGRWETNNLIGTRDGADGSADTTADVPDDLDQMWAGCYYNNAGDCTLIKNVYIYSTHTMKS